MSHSNPSITVNVDVTNPGQFFACCGLFELADRLWPGAEGWFEEHSFCIAGDGNLEELIKAITDLELRQIDADDKTESPIHISKPFHLTLDWWKDELTGARQLKVWAGSMDGVRIARAMQKAMVCSSESGRILDFDYNTVVYDPESNKKREPYSFDSRRGTNARSLDIGFSPDSLKNMTTAAYPAVEFFCLVGLQRFRPATTTNQPRVFKYCTWRKELPLVIASAVGSGLLSLPDSRLFLFETIFRTGQKKHKSFLPATHIGDSL